MGKQGLGIKDRPKKIAGARFQGKKTCFGEGSDEEPDVDFSVKKQKLDGTFESKNIYEPKVKLKKLCKQLLLQVHI